jgi:membrane protein
MAGRDLQPASGMAPLPGRRFPWRTFVERLLNRLDADNVTGLSAEVSYYFGLALFPFLIVLGALVGILPFTHSWQAILAWITHYLPTDIQQTAFDTVASLTQSREKFLSMGLIGSIWACSGGLTTLMYALNRIYRVTETRSYWKRLMLSVLLLFVLALLVIATFGLLSAGHWLDRLLVSSSGPHRAFLVLARVARWVVSLTVSILCVSFLDHVLPDRKRSFRWITPGSAIVVITWVLGTLGFNYYVLHVASYHRTYGILGGFFVLMVWIYISSLIALVGAEINSALEKTAR